MAEDGCDQSNAGKTWVYCATRECTVPQTWVYCATNMGVLCHKAKEVYSATNMGVLCHKGVYCATNMGVLCHKGVIGARKMPNYPPTANTINVSEIE